MKKLLLALTLLMLLSLFVACGSTVDEEPSHTHSYGEWMTSVAPSCTARGTQVRSCACGEQETQSIAMRAHSFGAWSVTTPATCTEKGTETRSCSCGKTETQDIPSAGAHEYGDWSVTLAPTCGTNGTKARSCSVCGDDDTEALLPTGAHVYGSWSVATPAGCGVEGLEKRLCACGASDTRPLAALSHTPLFHEEDAATCQRTGTAAHYECTSCHKYFLDATCSNQITDTSLLTLSITGHVYVKGLCHMCNKPHELYSCDGDTLYFGTYPQSEVTDTALIAALNAKAGTLPTAADAQAWTSYGYYAQGSVQNYMWYIDVTHNSERYRGVYFTAYRPYYVSNVAFENNSYQDDNGYIKEDVYWFKYEPIAWTILQENSGTALLLCDMILDSQAYQPQGNSGTATNNYMQSFIRVWLNETFYETAFSALQKQIIQTSAVINDVASTGASTNPYACDNTTDKIFLLSTQQASDASAGFNDAQYDFDTKRAKKPTEYAKAMGIYVSPNGSAVGNGRWWLRSPQNNLSDGVRLADVGGSINYIHADNTSIGVVPALRIRLS